MIGGWTLSFGSGWIAGAWILERQSLICKPESISGRRIKNTERFIVKRKFKVGDIIFNIKDFSEEHKYEIIAIVEGLEELY
jgi:hypothetical protein